MNQLEALVRARRSVRTYAERPILPQDMEKLCVFMQRIDNPYGLPISFRLLDAQKQKLSCPVVTGTHLYVGAKMKKAPRLNEAFGYSFEKLPFSSLDHLRWCFVNSSSLSYFFFQVNFYYFFYYGMVIVFEYFFNF